MAQMTNKHKTIHPPREFRKTKGGFANIEENCSWKDIAFVFEVIFRHYQEPFAPKLHQYHVDHMKMPMARKVEHMYHLVEQYCIKIFGGTFTQLHELDKKDFAKKMMAILLLDLRFSVPSLRAIVA